MTLAIVLAVVTVAAAGAYAVGYRTLAPRTTEQHFIVVRDTTASDLRRELHRLDLQQKRAGGPRLDDLIRRETAVRRLLADVEALTYQEAPR